MTNEAMARATETERGLRAGSLVGLVQLSSMGGSPRPMVPDSTLFALFSLAGWVVVVVLGVPVLGRGATVRP